MVVTFWDSVSPKYDKMKFNEYNCCLFSGPFYVMIYIGKFSQSTRILIYHINLEEKI